jgi:hypothetical protein
LGIMNFRKIIRSVIFCVLFITNYAFAQNNEPSTAGQIYKQASPSVVLVEIYNEEGSVFKTGTGFLVSAEGKILTNYHVIANTRRATVRLTNGDAYDTVEVIDIDKQKDLALIKIKAANLPFLTLGQSSAVEVGEKIYSISNPFGIFRNSLFEGLVSAVRAGSSYRFFQITAPVSPGSSGGPLINTKGEVVGLVFASAVSGPSLNFAIPIDYAKGMLFLNETKPLASVYEPEEMPDKKGEEKPQTTSNNIDYSALPEELRKDGLAAYFQRRIGLLTFAETEKLLGKSLRIITDKNLGLIHTFNDPTRFFRVVSFNFDKTSGKLSSIVGAPESDLTIEMIRTRFGKDEKSLRVKSGGQKTYVYPLTKMAFLTDKDGLVLTVSYY